MSDADADHFLSAILGEFEERPPTIGVIGLSGVGKSSTINAMFGTRKTVSATTRGTVRFHTSKHAVENQKYKGRTIRYPLHVVDAPGLGEDLEQDERYLAAYKKHLPKCDVALWVIAARNRALAVDQLYLKQLKAVLPNLVVGVNQVDLIEPGDWSRETNLPSEEQKAAMDEILADRKQRLAGLYGRRTPLVGYSAKKFYNLSTLFLACVEAAPKKRRWMFELIKGFSAKDWLAQVEGLAPAEKEAVIARQGGDQAFDASKVSLQSGGLGQSIAALFKR
ncbi:MAG: 50S ribosome-binding GTPase [Neomegalonema sp.]|nr:50S ribosome-binding GTPase [Neomegalonema sp.]